MAECKTCHAPIRWVLSAKTGNAMPVDADPSEQGNVKLDPDRGAEVLAGEKLLALREVGHPLYLSHFVTCPDAQRHRKEKGGSSHGSSVDS